MSADQWSTCPSCGSGSDEDEGVGLAEYFEFYGASTGTVTARYEASCRSCDFVADFEIPVVICEDEEE